MSRCVETEQIWKNSCCLVKMSVSLSLSLFDVATIKQGSSTGHFAVSSVPKSGFLPQRKCVTEDHIEISPMREEVHAGHSF